VDRGPSGKAYSMSTEELNALDCDLEGVVSIAFRANFRWEIACLCDRNCGFEDFYGDGEREGNQY
jgi:hypothetical protein